MKKLQAHKGIAEDIGVEPEVSIAPITENFGNGELAILKDKINEIIARG